MESGSHSDIVIDEDADDRVRKFLELYKEQGPSIDVTSIAKEVGVSKMTVYNWLRKIRAGLPLGVKGKRRKYGKHSSFVLAGRPAIYIKDKLEELAELNGVSMREYWESRLPFWVLNDYRMLQEARKDIEI